MSEPATDLIEAAGWIRDRNCHDLAYLYDLTDRLHALADEWEQRQAVIDAAVALVAVDRDVYADDCYDAFEVLIAAVDALVQPGTEGEG